MPWKESQFLLDRMLDQPQWTWYAAWAPTKAVFWVRPSGDGILDKPQGKCYALWAQIDTVCWISPLNALCCISPSRNRMQANPHWKRYAGWVPGEEECWNGFSMLDEPSGCCMLDESQGKRDAGMDSVCWMRPVDAVCWMSPRGSGMLDEPSGCCMLDESLEKRYKENGSALTIIRCLCSNPLTNPKPNDLLQLLPRSLKYWMTHVKTTSQNHKTNDGISEHGSARNFRQCIKVFYLTTLWIADVIQRQGMEGRGGEWISKYGTQGE